MVRKGTLTIALYGGGGKRGDPEAVTGRILLPTSNIYLSVLLKYANNALSLQLRITNGEEGNLHFRQLGG